MSGNDGSKVVTVIKPLKIVDISDLWEQKTLERYYFDTKKLKE
ncbi:hypothetical protein HMPREF9080_00056 [Cardiobacterium valvarum F0432]|uniref:Uncharacterized protein n=1 Tax=Cardiobacterium valvarum F0432 TaxID=797473 RepID=G9ZBD3_9GAMM|nr:hypothetical protein HMPREF9080_00056 [Cardiobacterium valvarum F0432]